MAVAAKDQTRELAVHLAGACHSRRLYAVGSSVWMRTLEALAADFQGWFASNPKAEVLTVALLGDGIAVSGVPVLHAPPTVARLTQTLRARDVEVVSFERATSPAELETFLSFLSTDPADLAAVKPATWLRERGVDHIEIKQLKLVSSGAGLESFRDVFRMGGQVLGREFQRAAKEGTVDMRPVAELARTMLGTLGSDIPLATLLALKERDDHTYVHSVNVGMVAGCQALAFGLSEAEVEEITGAGLVHDIGKARVPDAILQKGSALTLQEQALLNAHSVEGARMLIASQGTAKLGAIVALEHHRPSGSSHPSISLAAQLVALADTLDSLRTLRPFEHRHGLRGALTFMIQKLAGRFSPYMLSRFATLCGYFLPGDLAQLASGEVVKVVQPHPESIRHPVVEVVDTALGTLKPGTVCELTKPIDGKRLEIVLPTTEAFQTLDAKELDWLG